MDYLNRLIEDVDTFIMMKEFITEGIAKDDIVKASLPLKTLQSQFKDETKVNSNFNLISDFNLNLLLWEEKEKSIDIYNTICDLTQCIVSYFYNKIFGSEEKKEKKKEIQITHKRVGIKQEDIKLVHASKVDDTAYDVSFSIEKQTSNVLDLEKQLKQLVIDNTPLKQKVPIQIEKQTPNVLELEKQLKQLEIENKKLKKLVTENEQLKQLAIDYHQSKQKNKQLEEEKNTHVCAYGNGCYDTNEKHIMYEHSQELNVAKRTLPCSQNGNQLEEHILVSVHGKLNKFWYCNNHHCVFQPFSKQ
jgi:hypothetical protein